MVFAVPLSSAPKGADLLDRYPSINKFVPFFLSPFLQKILQLQIKILFG